MTLFLLLAFAAAVALYSPLLGAFMANPLFNGLILGVLVFGIVDVYRQVAMIYPEVAWLEAYRSEQPGLAVRKAPGLLGPMAKMLSGRQGRLSLSTMAMRSILDSIDSRLDESRDISRYVIGLLIFLGLLGTFWGLLLTITSVAQVISGLDIAGADMARAFDDFKSGLSQPLAGMGTAFSSSLFGLAGSLILGFLDLQAGQAQNRFYNELEEMLSASTRLAGAGALTEGDQSVPAYIQALLETTADSLENLQRTIAQGETERTKSSQGLVLLSERLSTLTDQMRSEQDLMVQLAQNQLEMRPILAKLASTATTSGLDDASRTHIRNLDVHLVRLLEEAANGRTQVVQEIRSEIRLLARTIAALAEDGEGAERR